MSSAALRLITQVGVVAALAVGISGVVVMDKAVAVSIGGEMTNVHAFGGTVGDVLEQQGIDLGPHDEVTPSADTRVDEGQTIVVHQARQLTVTLDGDMRTYWTTAETVGQALKEHDVRTGKSAVLSSPRSESIGPGGLELTISTPKNVTLVVGGERSAETVTAVTVGGALRQADVRYDANDQIEPGAWSEVTDGMTIKVDRIERTTTTRTDPVGHRTVTREDPSLVEGATEVERRGHDGVRTTTYHQTRKNGEVVHSSAERSRITDPPVNTVLLEGTGTQQEADSGHSSPSWRPPSSGESPESSPPSDSPSQPESSDAPSQPETSDSPSQPETSDAPSEPETSDSPSSPTSPQDPAGSSESPAQPEPSDSPSSADDDASTQSEPDRPSRETGTSELSEPSEPTSEPEPSGSGSSASSGGESGTS